MVKLLINTMYVHMQYVPRSRWYRQCTDVCSQGCLRPHHHQQGRRSDLSTGLRRGTKQAQYQRLPRSRRYIPWVYYSSAPFSYPLPTQLTFYDRVHAITTRLNPAPTPSLPPQTRPDPPAGIEVLESENFRLQCFTTLTGTKFLLFTEPMQPNVDRIMARIYELYSDYVMKNPFYSLEMPIRSEGWDRRLGGVVAGAGGR